MTFRTYTITGICLTMMRKSNYYFFATAMANQPQELFTKLLRLIHYYDFVNAGKSAII